MKADEKTAQVFMEFLTRHRAFEGQSGPVEVKIEFFLKLSQEGMDTINQKIELFFQKTNTHPHLLTPEEAEFMPGFITAVTKYLNSFVQFETDYQQYCSFVRKYYLMQQKVLTKVNEENISKETWHILYIQKEYLDDLEKLLRKVFNDFKLLSQSFKSLWQRFEASGLIQPGD